MSLGNSTSNLDGEAMESPSKVQHALWLLQAFEEMRNEKLICDFEIRMEGKSFAVHRAVLLPSSMYFKAMFSSNMREARRGYAEMKQLNVHGVEKCIDYMYTGEASINVENAQYIIEASHFLQIDPLTVLCRQFMRQHLEADNCLLVRNMFKLYGSESDVNAAENCIIENLNLVIDSEIFPEISSQDLIDYLKSSRSNAETHWKAISRWFQPNDSTKLQFFSSSLNSLLRIKDISSDLLMSEIWRHPNVQNDDETKRKILENLARITKTPEIGLHLNLENTFILLDVLRNHEFSGKNVLRKGAEKILAKNFHQLPERPEFCHLNVQNLSSVLESQYIRCKEETEKWEAILKWVKFSQQREENLHLLMQVIDFDEIAIDYLHQNMRNEAIVMKSPQCLQILYDALYAKSAPRKSAVILLDSQSGMLQQLDLTGKNNHVELPVTVAVSGAKVISVLGKLHIICDNALYKFSGKANWKKVTTLRKPLKTFQVVAQQNYIYMIDSSDMTRYDAVNKQWCAGLTGCGLGSGFCVAATTDAIYACGGGLGSTKSVKCDLASLKWRETTPMKEKRTQAASSIFGGKLYVMGGYEITMRSTEWNYKKSVEIYDESSKTWNIATSMKRMRSNFSVAVCNNRMYAVGGASEGNQQQKDSVEVYESESSQWKIVAELRRPEGQTTSCVCNAILDSEASQTQANSYLLQDQTG